MADNTRELTLLHLKQERDDALAEAERQRGLKEEWRTRAFTAAADHHCSTCQCVGTACSDNSWCVRTWRHRGTCSIIPREEDR